MQNAEYESIVNIVRYIQGSPETDKENAFKERFAVFKAKYPHLYHMACTQPDFDMSNLQFMLQMLQQIQNKDKDKLTAETAVGQMLFDKYVKAPPAKQ